MALPDTLQGWFQSATRVQIRFQVQDVLNSQERSLHISCHLLEDLAAVTVPGHPANLVADQETQVITFLHGYPGCSYDYIGVLRSLFQERRLRARLLLIDLPGYGDSDKGVGEARFSIQQHANVILAIWQRFGIMSSHLVAHDLSVSVAQELLARQPKGRLSVEVGKIFWINGSLFIDLNRPMPLQKSMCTSAGWLVARLLSVSSLSKALSDLFSQQHPPSKELLEYMHASLVHRDGLKVHHKLVRFLKDRTRFKHVWQGALELAMRRDPQRMMFFWGMQDAKSGPHISAELHRRYNKLGLRIQEHSDLGHWPHLEDPARVASALTAFFMEPYTPKYRYKTTWSAEAEEERSSKSLHWVTLQNGVLCYGPNGGALSARRRSMQRSSSASSLGDAREPRDGIASTTSAPIPIANDARASASAATAPAALTSTPPRGTPPRSSGVRGPAAGAPLHSTSGIIASELEAIEESHPAAGAVGAEEGGHEVSAEVVQVGAAPVDAPQAPSGALSSPVKVPSTGGVAPAPAAAQST